MLHCTGKACRRHHCNTISSRCLQPNTDKPNLPSLSCAITSTPHNVSGSGFGGVGKQYSIRTGSLEYYAGGGGASSGNNVNAIGALGGLGGGGKGGGGSRINQGTGNLIGEDGKPNTGGGGGGTLSSRSVKGGDGGSGIVVIRYQL